MRSISHPPTARRTALAGLGAVAIAALISAGAVSAQAYNPAGSVVTQLGSEPCLKGRGNCIIYPKSTQLANGDLVMAFEKATVVPESGSALGETMPIWTSTDDGTSWNHFSDVPAPAFLSDDPKFAKYVSNWTNPDLYVLPQDVGSLTAGTLLLASVVSGDDEYYKEQKAADPNWVPTSDGDRSNIAIALFSSTDNGSSWNVVDIIAQGGWQGGSAGNQGGAFSALNTFRQQDPVWEPHLDVRDGKLVAYYSDENDYLGFDPQTGVAQIDPDNATAPDSRGQILAHKTWDGIGAWSDPVIDVPGLVQDRGNGKTQIGGGRPGMTTIAHTTDDKWMMTFEYFGGGTVGRFKIADDPLKFYASDITNGTGVDELPVTAGSSVLNRGGSPVTVTLPDGRIIFNSDGSGNIWVNDSGRSDGTWTQYQSPLGSGYSRELTYVEGTGRVNILQGVWGGPTSGSEIRSADVDLGNSDGSYYQLVNKKTGQVIGTGDNPTDANIGNGNQADIVLETAGAATDRDTQYWHIVTKKDGKQALLNKAGGREATTWLGGAFQGQQLGQWVDEADTGRWTLETNQDGTVRFRSVVNPGLYVSGAAADGPVTLSAAIQDGSQDWQLVALAPESAQLDTRTKSAAFVTSGTVESGASLSLSLNSTHADATGRLFLFSEGAPPVSLGSVTFDADGEGTVVVPTGTPSGPARIAVTLDDAPLVWDDVTVTGGVAPSPVVDRIGGADRFDVSVNTSKAGFPNGASTVFVASGEVFPDALSAAPAATVANAPILLTMSKTVPESVRAEIERLKPGKIVIVGGENTISAAVEAQLAAVAPVTRIGGADRFEVSRNVAASTFPGGAPLAVIATGANFPDALSAGAAVKGIGPVVLVNGSQPELDAATSNLLSRLGVSAIAIAGGSNSVSDGIRTQSEAIASTFRLGGADRYEASRSINAFFADKADRVLLATGEKFPDALSGSAFGPRVDAPLFTVPGSCVPDETMAQITALGATKVTLLGGEATLSKAVAELTPCAAG